MARLPVTSFWRGRRVLVTGHTGFKGAWLTLWLHALGAEVTGFSGPPPTTPSLFELARVGELCRDLRGDVRDPGAVAGAARGAEVVFHLAAQAIVRAALEDPAGTYAVNVLGTEHVLAAAGDAPVVCVTSDKAYAAGPRPHVEGDPLGGAGDQITRHNYHSILISGGTSLPFRRSDPRRRHRRDSGDRPASP